VTNNVDVETHTVFIGKVVEAQVTGEGEMMTYAYCYQVKKGKSPQNAPTYIKEDRLLQNTFCRSRSQ